MADLDNKIENLDKMLDEYEGRIGLPKYGDIEDNDKYQEEMKKYFTMDRTDLEALMPEECLEIACRLNQFSLHLQRSQNRQSARMNWAESTAKKIGCPLFDNYNGWGFDEKFAKVMADNEPVRKLMDVHRLAKQCVDRLNFLSRSIDNFANTLKDLQKAKTKYEKV